MKENIQIKEYFTGLYWKKYKKIGGGGDRKKQELPLTKDGRNAMI